MNLEEIKERAELVALTTERLTRRGKKNKAWVLLNKICSKADGSFCPHAIICNHVENRTCPYLDALDRLAAYEDTGISPEEVMEIKGK